MKQHLIAALVGVTLVAGGAGSAKAIDGNELLEFCSNNVLGICQGYFIALDDTTTIRGVDENTNTVMHLYRPQLLRWCVPAEAFVSQVRDIGIAWLKAHPSIRHNHAPSLIARALRDAWPCHK
jgi:hypothetical protein